MRSRDAMTPGLRTLLAALLVAAAVLTGTGALMGAESLLAWADQGQGETRAYQYLFALHLGLGLLSALPVLIYVFAHGRRGRGHANRLARRRGSALAGALVLVVATGILLTRGVASVELPASIARSFAYWLHVLLGFSLLLLYLRHRRAGPSLQPGWGWALAAIGATVSVAVVVLFGEPPAPSSVSEPLTPSFAKTHDGETIEAALMMQDARCAQCHADVHDRWAASAHRFASFNNPAYLFSVRATRAHLAEVGADPRTVRFCAGCHDIVPLLSGRLDHPDFDDQADPTATAGVNCVVCHAVQSVDSVRGNADLTWAPPAQYPFAQAQQRWLQAVNRALIRANPSLHRRTFLKPLHRSSEFCGACHKVSIPEALNQYRWLRGQNHYDSFLLSGVSGHSASSFYYPEQPRANCNGCHMPFRASQEPGARSFGPEGELGVHDHYSAGGNSALPALMGLPDWTFDRQRDLLQGSVRLDLFGLRAGDSVDAPLTAPLEPAGVSVTAGEPHVLELVIRNLSVGHLLTEGTADSNEMWVELTVSDTRGVVATSGHIDASGIVDPTAHFVHRYVLDRHGDRVDRRNVEDIFVALYDHQIPPGAAAVVHYALDLPVATVGPVHVRARLRYRKFDRAFQERFARNPQEQVALPIIDLAAAELRLDPTQPADQPEGVSNQTPTWERWNDYGIGLLLKPGRAQLRQAAEAFARVEALGSPHGAVNLARVALAEGDLDTARAALERARNAEFPFPWVIEWLAARLDFENGFLAEAAERYERILATDFAEARARDFDFSVDYRVHETLARTLFEQARAARGRPDAQRRLLTQAAASYRSALVGDPERASSHYGLAQVLTLLDDDEAAQHHRRLHARYRTDDNARDAAIAQARRRDPFADAAAEPTNVYPLHAVLPP